MLEKRKIQLACLLEKECLFLYAIELVSFVQPPLPSTQAPLHQQKKLNLFIVCYSVYKLYEFLFLLFLLWIKLLKNSMVSKM